MKFIVIALTVTAVLAVAKSEESQEGLSEDVAKVLKKAEKERDEVASSGPGAS